MSRIVKASRRRSMEGSRKSCTCSIVVKPRFARSRANVSETPRSTASLTANSGAAGVRSTQALGVDGLTFPRDSGGERFQVNPSRLTACYCSVNERGSGELVTDLPDEFPARPRLRLVFDAQGALAVHDPQDRARLARPRDHENDRVRRGAVNGRHLDARPHVAEQVDRVRSLEEDQE